MSKTGLPSEDDMNSMDPVPMSIETVNGSLHLQNEWENAMAESSQLVSAESPQAHFSTAPSIENGDAAEADHQLGVGESSSSENGNGITLSSPAVPQGSAPEMEYQPHDPVQLQEKDLGSDSSRQGRKSSENELANSKMDEDVEDQQLSPSKSGKTKPGAPKKTRTPAQVIDSASEEDEEAKYGEESIEDDPLEPVGDNDSPPKRKRRRSAAEMLAAATQKLMETPAYSNFSIDLTVNNGKSASPKRKADDCPLVETPQKKRSQRIREQEDELVATGSQQGLAVQPPKKRGRPPNVQKATAPKLSTTKAITDPPKRRGRPPKVKTNVIDVDSLPEVTSATALAVQSGGAYDVPETPKKRGRSKKVTPVAAVAAVQTGQAQEASPVTPKRRGRPPKVKQ
ncbi:hypothetical protein LIA77_10944 [Sarocladium implicatum]|nr:hypothetical protein LIA77_10944 [Sarocladium implicatum]